jgi:hypothetical protein
MLTLVRLGGVIARNILDGDRNTKSRSNGAWRYNKVQCLATLYSTLGELILSFGRLDACVSLRLCRSAGVGCYYSSSGCDEGREHWKGGRLACWTHGMTNELDRYSKPAGEFSILLFDLGGTHDHERRQVQPVPTFGRTPHVSSISATCTAMGKLEATSSR